MNPHAGFYPSSRPVPTNWGRVALTGSTGFIGSAIAEAFERAVVPVSVLQRRPLNAMPGGSSGIDDSPAPRRCVVGDLRDVTAVRDLLSDAHVLVHAASYVGPDPRLQDLVNVAGTSELVAQARLRGVARIVYVSTAGVYGGRLGPGLAEDEAIVAPRSRLSRSRRQAEEIVLDAGGVVVRPHLIHGTGDRWFLGQVLGAMLGLDAWIGGRNVALSTIGRRRLGAIICELVGTGTPPGVYHAAERFPVRVHDLVAPVYSGLGLELPQQVLALDEAASALEPAGITRQQVDLVGADSWFQCERLWHLLARSPLHANPTPQLPEGVSWYIDQIQRRRNADGGDA